MKLISCSYCGTVLDTDRIIEPSVYRHDEGTVITEQAAWVSADNDFKPFIQCSSCNTNILYHNGQEV